MQYKVTKVYSDENGDSHFEDFIIPLEDNGEIGFLSQPQNAGTIIFRKVSPDYDYDFHTAPAKQYIILLDGGVEIETSLGEKRIFETGSVLLMEDITGKGHRTKNLNNEIRTSIFVTLGT